MEAVSCVCNKCLNPPILQLTWCPFLVLATILTMDVMVDIILLICKYAEGMFVFYAVIQERPYSSTTSFAGNFLCCLILFKHLFFWFLWMPPSNVGRYFAVPLVVLWNSRSEVMMVLKKPRKVTHQRSSLHHLNCSFPSYFLQHKYLWKLRYFSHLNWVFNVPYGYYNFC